MASGSKTWHEPPPFVFPGPRCARRDGLALDPDRLYCEVCLQAMAIAMMEDWR